MSPKSRIQSPTNWEKTRLADVIPLETPYMVFIDPCNSCNFRCNFCAPQTLRHEAGYQHMLMDYSRYRGVIDDISRFPRKLRILRLYTMGEPLFNPAFPDMVAYAKKMDVADGIETVTNGSLLTPELNQRLANSGIKRIRISVEGINDDTYKRVCGSDLKVSHLVDMIADLFRRTRGTCTQIYVKTVDASVKTKEEQERFYDMFSDISDSMFIEHIGPIWPEFDELNDRYSFSEQSMMGEKKADYALCCPYVFYGLVVNPDGEVTPCCADWKRGYSYGNAFQTPLTQIWGNEAMKLMWREMLKGNRQRFKSCKNCEYLQYTAHDYLDGDAEDILKRL